MLNELLNFNSWHQLNWSLPTLTQGATATFFLLISFSVFIATEYHAPERKVSKWSIRQSYCTNFSLFFFNSLAMSLLSASTLWVVAKQHFNQSMLHWIESPAWKIVISFVLLDLLLYLWHLACHRYHGLWMFHRVHHNDPYLNVSTGFRVHIIELFMTYILKLTLIVLMGIDELIVLISEVITTFFIMFHHTNSVFKGEKWLGYIFTTPSLHRTHHSVERGEHDRNYGAILSVWDQLFGTLLKVEPKKIGINGYSPQDFINLVKFGFVEKLSPLAMPANFDAMIAEAAYYKAEKRNFNPGQEWDDWLEAKLEIIDWVYSNRTAPENPLNIFLS